MSGFDCAPHVDQLTAAYREVVAELVGDEALRQRCAAVQALVVQLKKESDMSPKQGRPAGRPIYRQSYVNGCRS